MNPVKNDRFHAARHFSVDSENPQPEIIRAAAAVVVRGGLVVFPTRYLYGLGADAFNPGALKRVFAVKRRPADRPLPVLIAEKNQLNDLVQRIPLPAARLMEKFWPGRLTLVFDARTRLPDTLTAASGKIGVRLVGHPVAAALVRAVGRPVTATSANVSGAAGCFRVKELAARLSRMADLILNAGTLKGGAGSTVVDVSVDPPRILRPGAVPTEVIGEVLAPGGLKLG